MQLPAAELGVGPQYASDLRGNMCDLISVAHQGVGTGVSSTLGEPTPVLPADAEGCGDVCTRRCCQRGKRMLVIGDCSPDSGDVEDFLPVTYRWPDLAEVHYDDLPPPGAIRGDPCPRGKYVLEPGDVPEDVFYLLDDGRLFVPGAADEPYNTSQFCVEPAGAGGELTAFLCWTNPGGAQVAVHSVVVAYPVGMLVSLPFLVATFLVYSLIPRLNNFHGKALRSHVGSSSSATSSWPSSSWRSAT
ncbi:hypothetical protein PR048_018082 [Dryococelus australis]|uniref:Methuselah N-terminal domain-containing protein n=1 Tax=Dryococelus australis TaxID=614101 RepID=A0ABQ9HB99_9NEOP|nr:hypothetical protein PR048_018082 [Dryococelus australis]